MKPIVLFLVIATTSLSACETRQQSTLTGAAAGAALGATVSGPGDQLVGALIGGAAGAAAGNYIGGTNTPGQCLYQYPNGQQYTAAC